MPNKITADFFQEVKVTAVESAANAGICQAVPTAYSPTDQVGLVIEEVEYLFLSAVESLMDTSSDNISYGLSFMLLAAAAMLLPTSYGVVDFNRQLRIDISAVGSHFLKEPTRRSFAHLTGGGLLVHPTALFTYHRGAGLSGAVTMVTNIKYHKVNLTEQAYRELWEQRIIGSTT